MHSDTIQKLINLFSKFPTVGPRTAGRFVFYLLKLPKEEVDNLIFHIIKLKENTSFCQSCFQPFEPIVNHNPELCEICQDPRRDKSLLCIVEKESDLASIEKIKKYKGLYFIIGGTVSALKKKDIEKLRIQELKEIIKNPEIKEIIIAINPTLEGEATTLYLERLLKKNLPADKRITRLGRGLPIGAELEYADEETLSDSLENRK